MQGGVVELEAVAVPGIEGGPARVGTLVVDVQIVPDDDDLVVLLRAVVCSDILKQHLLSNGEGRRVCRLLRLMGSFCRSRSVQPEQLPQPAGETGEHKVLHQ